MLPLVSDLVYTDVSGCSSNTCNLLSPGYFHVRNRAKLTQIQANTRSILVPHCVAEKERKSVNLVEVEFVVYCIPQTSKDALCFTFKGRSTIRCRIPKLKLHGLQIYSLTLELIAISDSHVTLSRFALV